MIGADDSDPGTQFSGIDAASASNASTGSEQQSSYDPANDPTASGNDPFSYFDPVTGGYSPGVPSTSTENSPLFNELVNNVLEEYDAIAGLIPSVSRGTSWAMLGEDPQYGFRGVEAPAIPDRSPNYAYGMEDYPVDRVVTQPNFAPATQPTATASGRSIPNVTTDTSGRPQLEALVAAGLGNVTGLNPNNPDQTAQQLLNSFRANDFLTEYAPSLFTAGMPPGMGLAFNAIRTGADIAAGRTTPGQALTGLGLEALASKLGIPGGGRVVGDLLEGRVGPAAGGAAAGVATGALARAGLGPLAGVAMKESGLGSAISKGVSGAVQPQPEQGTGIVSSLADAINRGAQGIMGLFGGTSSAPIPATPGVTTPTRGYTPPDYNLYESSPNETPAAATAPTTPAVEPEVAAARRLLYGVAQGPYGPLLAYDFGEA